MGITFFKMLKAEWLRRLVLQIDRARQRPQCPLGRKGQRSGDDTSTPSPVQSVRARTGRGHVCVD
ncbi:hypothetical protein NQZ68_038188 [Dissostichus eleginoides]|nr:hypothetical protein NQZ68_038188 [Dissostichus eleginoides]